MIGVILVAGILITRSRNKKAKAEAESSWQPLEGMLTDAQKAERHRREWERYTEAFLNGALKIGTFARDEMCMRCPMTRGNDDQPRRLVTQVDWNQLTDALVSAGIMYKSAAGSGMVGGKTVSDIRNNRDVKYPSRRCPVTSNIRRDAQNWLN